MVRLTIESQRSSPPTWGRRTKQLRISQSQSPLLNNGDFSQSTQSGMIFFRSGSSLNGCWPAKVSLNPLLFHGALFFWESSVVSVSIFSLGINNHCIVPNGFETIEQFNLTSLVRAGTRYTLDFDIMYGTSILCFLIILMVNSSKLMWSNLLK